MGLAAIKASGLPGSLEDAKRAGITQTDVTF